ncbi:MAG: hypothetical protein ACK4IY_02020, partial [Chitinophagales bacterium]
MAKVIVNGQESYLLENGQINGEAVGAEIVRTGERFYHILDNGKSYTAEVMHIDVASKMLTLRINNSTYEVQVKESLDLLLEKMGFDSTTSSRIKDMKAPMPGCVLGIRVTTGQTVQKGD